MDLKRSAESLTGLGLTATIELASVEEVCSLKVPVHWML